MKLIPTLITAMILSFSSGVFAVQELPKEMQSAEASRNLSEAIRLYKSDKSLKDKEPSFKYFLDNAGINIEALYYMGLITYNGEFTIHKNEELGLEMIKKAAESNYNPALIFVAKDYIKKDDIESKQKGLQILISNRFSKDRDVLYYLGDLYDVGKYVVQNKADANRFFLDSAELGSIDSSFRIGVVLIKSNDESKKSRGWDYLKKAANGENGNACLILATQMRDNALGKNEKVAIYIRYLKCAANAGDSKSAREIGSYYLTGRYLKNDAEEAYKYFNIYLKNNQDEITPDIYFQIGLLSVQTGNMDTAQKYLKIASDNNVSNASYYLGRLFESGYWSDGKIDVENAKHYYGLSGTQGRANTDIDIERVISKKELNNETNKAQ